MPDGREQKTLECTANSERKALKFPENIHTKYNSIVLYLLINQSNKAFHFENDLK